MVVRANHQNAPNGGPGARAARCTEGWWRSVIVGSDRRLVTPREPRVCGSTGGSRRAAARADRCAGPLRSCWPTCRIFVRVRSEHRTVLPARRALGGSRTPPTASDRNAASRPLPSMSDPIADSVSERRRAADRCRAVQIYRFCHRSAQAPVLLATRGCKRVYAGPCSDGASRGPVVVARCGDGWLAGLWSGGWLWAGLGPMAGEVGLAGQGGPAEDGGEFCCLGSLAFPFGLDGREH